MITSEGQLGVEEEGGAGERGKYRYRDGDMSSLHETIRRDNDIAELAKSCWKKQYVFPPVVYHRILFNLELQHRFALFE